MLSRIASLALVASVVVAIGAACHDVTECVPGASKPCRCADNAKGAALCTEAGSFAACDCRPSKPADGEPCTPLTKETCACGDGGAGLRQCSSSGAFGACVCDVSADGGDGPGPTASGRVDIVLQATNSGNASWFVLSQFAKRAPVACAPATKQGVCGIYHCPFPPQADVLFDAGEMRYSADGISIVTKFADGRYLPGVFVGSIATVDSLIRVAAAGATVPAFETALRYPARIAVTAPAMPDGGELELVRAASLPIAWQPVSAPSEVIVRYEVIEPLSGVPSGNYVQCAFDGQLGSGVVPSSLVQQLSGDLGLISIHTERTASVVVEAPDGTRWQIDLATRFVGDLGAGVAATYNFHYLP